MLRIVIELKPWQEKELTDILESLKNRTSE
jgi:hypothetical protein